MRGGAHSAAGNGVGDGGITIDLRSMNAVEVDPLARRALVGGGALLRELDEATQAHGLAVPAGEVGHTGVGGLTLGGGMGWLTRLHGLTIDSMLSAEVVLADGSIVRASAQEHPDLFWALRGGGGNFGVVTQFEFQLHEVGPLIHAGIFFYGLDQGADALRLARDVIAGLPPEVTFQVVALSAPPAPFVPEEFHFRPVYALVAIGFGAPEQHASVAQQLREGLPPLFELVTPMPYTALQTLFDDANAWGLYSYEKSSYLAEISDEVIEIMTAQVPGKASPLSVVHLYLLNGGYSQVPDEATAFGGGRSPRLGAFMIGVAPDPEGLAAERAWVRRFHEALGPVALGQGTYINSLGDEPERVAVSYGPKYERLSQIKAVYDPANVFHRNSNIRPAADGGLSQVPSQRPQVESARETAAGQQ